MSRLLVESREGGGQDKSAKTILWKNGPSNVVDGGLVASSRWVFDEVCDDKSLRIAKRI